MNESIKMIAITDTHALWLHYREQDGHEFVRYEAESHDGEESITIFEPSDRKAIETFMSVFDSERKTQDYNPVSPNKFEDTDEAIRKRRLDRHVEIGSFLGSVAMLGTILVIIWFMATN